MVDSVFESLEDAIDDVGGGAIGAVGRAGDATVVEPFGFPLGVGFVDMVAGGNGKGGFVPIPADPEAEVEVCELIVKVSLDRCHIEKKPLKRYGGGGVPRDVAKVIKYYRRAKRE